MTMKTVTWPILALSVIIVFYFNVRSLDSTLDTRSSSSELSNFYPLNDPLLDIQLRSDSDLVRRVQFLPLLLLLPLHSFLAINCHCCFFLSPSSLATLVGWKGGWERIGGIQHPSASNHFSPSLIQLQHPSAFCVHRSVVVISLGGERRTRRDSW